MYSYCWKTKDWKDAGCGKLFYSLTRILRIIKLTNTSVHFYDSSLFSPQVLIFLFQFYLLCLLCLHNKRLCCFSIILSIPVQDYCYPAIKKGKKKRYRCPNVWLFFGYYWLGIMIVYYLTIKRASFSYSLTSATRAVRHFVLLFLSFR